MARKIASAGLALSVIWAVASLVVKGGVGVNQAFSLDFNFSLIGAKAEITHETANACLGNSSLISCEGLVHIIPYPTNMTYTESYNGFDSDSYELLASLALSDPTELNQSIQFALAPGNCDEITNDPSSLPSGTWSGFIPGGSLHKITNWYWTNYNFEGNIPTSTGLFDHLEFNLTIPRTGKATMSLEGNANLCGITKPMAFALYIPDTETSEVDFSCVTIPKPDLDTLDISSAYCPLTSSP